MNEFNLIEDEIISIEEYDVIDTIDISVEKEHCFFANEIYTHNSGFDSELVEAHQSGGNIKRVQKAHFFMSVAKTPEQKEAHLANIRIIKARFAHDGQTFKDCIFNNDTMQIIIRDDRYLGNNYSKGMKKYGDAEIEKLEKTITDVHVAISQKIDEGEIPLTSNSEYDSAVLSDLREQFIKQKNIPDEEIKNNILSENIDISEIEKNLINPDFVDSKEKNIQDMLKLMSKDQNILKK